jgi:hypothetical protein
VKLYRYLFFIPLFFLLLGGPAGAELRPLADTDMGNISARTGIVSRMMALKSFSPGGNSETSRFANLLHIDPTFLTNLRNFERNIREFGDAFLHAETRPLADGWTWFEVSYTSEHGYESPAEQLPCAHFSASPVEGGLGLLGMGGFQVERSGTTRIEMSGKIKIEFRP